MRYALFAPLCLLALGCGGSAGYTEEFVEACTSSSNLDDAVCECMAEKAEADLNEREREFVLAALQEDEERVEELREELGMTSAVRAGMFMTNVATCALEEAEP